MGRIGPKDLEWMMSTAIMFVPLYPCKSQKNLLMPPTPHPSKINLANLPPFPYIPHISHKHLYPSKFKMKSSGQIKIFHQATFPLKIMRFSFRYILGHFFRSCFSVRPGHFGNLRKCKGSIWEFGKGATGQKKSKKNGVPYGFHWK